MGNSQRISLVPPSHVVVDGQGSTKFVKVSSYEKFEDLCSKEEGMLVNSSVVVYGLPYLPLTDASLLGISMGDLMCKDIRYTIGNENIVNQKVKRHISTVGKKMAMDTLMLEMKDIRPKKKRGDLGLFELSRRHAWTRYITSLMRSGADGSVQDAIKAFSPKLYKEIYGGVFGFDEQKFNQLKLQYLEEHQDAVNSDWEMQNVLSAQGMLSLKQTQDELRGDFVSLISSFELGIKSIYEELERLSTTPSLVGMDGV